MNQCSIIILYIYKSIRSPWNKKREQKKTTPRRSAMYLSYIMHVYLSPAAHLKSSKKHSISGINRRRERKKIIKTGGNTLEIDFN